MTAPEYVETDLREQVVTTICAVLSRILGRDEPVGEYTALRDELCLDSAQALELLLELEEELRIHIDVATLGSEEMSTVGELADFIANHSQQQ